MNCVINDKLFKKLAEFRKGGKENLLIVSDFDRTLTKEFTDAGLPNSTYAALRNSGLMPEEYSRLNKEWYEKYHKIELSREVSVEQKMPLMIEWWEMVMRSMFEYGLTAEVIKQIVGNRVVQMRPGFGDFLEAASEVPLIIVSAGVGDIIQGIINGYGRFDNVNVVSNFLDFKRKCYKSEIVHALNKTGSFISRQPWFEARKNVIVLGDTPDDLAVLEGLPYDSAIKFGFSGRTDALEGYDVIVRDGRMDCVVETIREILG
ncbi:MAG: haloacid dehalogenase-like hydrolase [Candidatus Woesearchaeota archaeon]